MFINFTEQDTRAKRVSPESLLVLVEAKRAARC